MNLVTPTYTHKAFTLFFRYTKQDQLAPSSTNLITACTSNKTQNTSTKVSIQFCVSRGQPPYYFVNKKMNPVIPTYTHKALTLFFRYTEQDQLAPSSTNYTACTSNKTQNTSTKVSIQGYLLLSLSMCVTLTLCVFPKSFSKIFSKFFRFFFSKDFAKFFSKIATHGFYNGIFGPWAW